MNEIAEKIVSEALELSPALRAFVAEKLIESLDMSPAVTLSPKWKAKIRKRCKEIDSNTVELHDAEVVLEKANGALQ